MVRDTSLCGLGQSAPNPVLTTLRHFRHEFEDHVRARRCPAGVCEKLALSPCENSCPLHMNIPRFLQLHKEGRIEDAFLSIVLDNPLPASTGRVCQHPCDDRCRRAGLDQAVNMRDVHRLIADAVLLGDRFEAVRERLLACRRPPSGRRVAVVGAGPAGLTCAYYLALLGHGVSVYESRAEAGGMLRYALPEYRLPKRVLERELELIRSVGVAFEFGASVGNQVSLNDLAQQFEAVFLAIGTWKESWVYLPGTELQGVIPALPFLEGVADGRPAEVAGRVAVIGGGNAAIDSARTARRLGAEVTIVYRRERRDMPAIPKEIEEAEAEGVQFTFLASPHRIVGDAAGRVRAMEIAKTRPGAFDSSGRRRPIATGEIQRLECGTVILAVGETIDPDFAKASGLEVKESGTLVVDRYTLETSRSGFYAGGDLITGASNVSSAMGCGKQAARSIDKRLMGADRLADLTPAFEYSMEPPETPSDSPRHQPRERPLTERTSGDAEVSLGLSYEAALEEAARCLRCDVKEAHCSAS
jgi:NADH-quinone oxidoreductase subunit F